MPTIEIVCLKQKTLLDFSDLPFAVKSEAEVISHRSLFYKEFRALKGCIYHLGNPGQENEVGCFAGALLEWNDAPDDALFFLPQYAPHVRNMMQKLIEASPISRLIFSSDYQFGPPRYRPKRTLTLDQFWEKQDEGKLYLNARYHLKP